VFKSKTLLPTLSGSMTWVWERFLEITGRRIRIFHSGYMVIQGFPCAKHVAGGFRCIATNSPVVPIKAFVTRSVFLSLARPDDSATRSSFVRQAKLGA